MLFSEWIVIMWFVDPVKVLLIAFLAFSAAGAAFAAPVADPGAAAPIPFQGRKNPFRPLILPRPSAPPALPAVTLPSLPPAPASEPALRLRAELAGVEFMGVAYDDDEALAATRIEGQTRFLRVGDRVRGATLLSIAADRIVLKKNGRLLTRRLPTP